MNTGVEMGGIKIRTENIGWLGVMTRRKPRYLHVPTASGVARAVFFFLI